MCKHNDARRANARRAWIGAGGGLRVLNADGVAAARMDETTVRVKHRATTASGGGNREQGDGRYGDGSDEDTNALHGGSFQQSQRYRLCTASSVPHAVGR